MILPTTPPNTITNIHEFHEWICDQFTKERNSKKKRLQRIKKLKWILKHGSETEIHDAQNEIKTIRGQIAYYSGSDFDTYISRVEPILCSFDQDMSCTDDERETREEYVNEILDVMTDYVTVPANLRDKFHGKLSKTTKKKRQDKDTYSPEFRELSHINCTPRYKYTRSVHFGSTIDTYQGKQHRTISPKVYDHLWSRASAYGISKPTKLHIYIWLREGDKEMTDHYEDINLIHHEMTGEETDDIEYLREKLLIFHNFIEIGFNKLELSRHNIISVWYILWVGLNKFGHKCDCESFTILLRDTSCTRDTIDEYEDIMKLIFSYHGWIFPRSAAWLVPQLRKKIFL
jgi:hypothetical protein